MHFKSFFEQFFLPELRSFLRKWTMILGVIAIMSLALWSIGFSAGSSSFLEERMDSPFIRFLSVNLPNFIDGQANYQERLEVEYSKDQTLERYGINESHFVPTGRINFLGDENKVFRTRIRVIEPGTRLYQFLFRDNRALLLTKEKLIRMDESPWSAVVSKELLLKLGYDPQEPPLFLEHVPIYDEERLIKVPILIAGIVEQLPDKMGAFFSKEAFYSITNRTEYSPFDPDLDLYERSLTAFIASEGAKEELQQKLDEILKDFQLNIRLEKSKASYAEGYDLSINSLDASKRQAVEKALKNAKDLKSKVVITYPYDRVNRGSITSDYKDFMVMEFAELDSVPVVADQLQNNYDLNVNLNDVESARNFSVFNKMSTILSAILTIFTILIIIYIVSKTIIEHIDQHKASLGTLKAFGLSNLTITAVYSGVALIIVMLVFGSGFLIAYAIGNGLNPWILNHILDLKSIDDPLFLLEFNLLYLSVFLILPLLIILILVYNKLSGTTPGDLIYGR